MRVAVLVLSVLVLSACGGRSQHQTFYDNQTLRQQGTMDGYKPVGVWTTYHPDGSLASEGAFEDGKQHARWRYGHPDGVNGGLGYWSAGVQHGWWELRDADGRIEQRGLMLDGQRVGPWIVDGTERTYGTPDQQHADGAEWRHDRGSVTLLAGSERAAIHARWTDGGEYFLLEKLPTTAVETGPGETISITSKATDAAGDTQISAQPQSGLQTQAADAAAVLPAADQPVASEDLQLITLPPRIEFGTVAKFFGDRFTKRYLQEAASAGSSHSDKAGDKTAAAAVESGNAAGQDIIGKPLPISRFVADDGGLIDLKNPGKPTVLVIMRGFSGSVCLYCTAQTVALAQMSDDFKKAGVGMLVLYPGSVESIAAFKDSVAQLQRADMPELPFRMALDVNQLLVRKLNIRGDLSKPTSLILDAAGVVRWAYVGADMGDRPTVKTLLDKAQGMK